MKTLLFLLAFPLALNAQNYALIWSDEFPGTALDPGKWTYEIGQGSGGWGNNELQYYTASPTNVFVDTGYLHIVGKVENIGGAYFSSSRIKTQGLFDFQYGKVEARLKVPNGQGLWPAFWMLGSNITTVSWPLCGEIDIMEHVNNELIVHGTHHYEHFGHQYEGDQIFADATQFHEYTVEWTPDAITWFMDGTQYYETNIGSGSVSKEEFHEPFFLLLNLAIGGNWPGNPNPSTIFPATMMVDYVRVYQESNGMEDAEMSSVTVSPNPATETISISSENELESYTVVNLQGEQLLHGVAASIDVSTLSAGFYYLHVVSVEGAVSRTSFVKR